MNRRVISKEHNLSSSENNTQKKIRPVQNLNPWPEECDFNYSMIGVTLRNS